MEAQTDQRQQVHQGQQLLILTRGHLLVEMQQQLQDYLQEHTQLRLPMQMAALTQEILLFHNLQL